MLEEKFNEVIKINEKITKDMDLIKNNIQKIVEVTTNTQRKIVERLKDHCGRDKNSHVFRHSFNNKHGEITMENVKIVNNCLLYTSPSPRDGLLSRMPSSA